MSSTTRSLFVLLLLLAGCTEPGPDTVGLPRAADVSPTYAALSGYQCTVVAQVFPTPHDVVAQHLPPGYHPTDLSDMVGLAAPAGRSGYAFASVSCLGGDPEPYDFAIWMLFIETPHLAEANGLSRDAIDVYALSWFTGDHVLRDSLRAAGVDVTDASISISDLTTLAPAGNLGAATATRSDVTDDDGPRVASTTLATTVVDLTFDDLRAWAETPQGTVVFESSLEAGGIAPADISIGSSTCTIRPDSRPAIAGNRTDCAPQPDAPEPTIGVNVVDFAFVDTGLHVLPGQFEL